MNVKVCVSRIVFVSEADVRLAFVRRASGANTVRYAEFCGISFRANGFVGRGDVGRVGRGNLVGNGSKVERSVDIGTGVC